MEPCFWPKIYAILSNFGICHDLCTSETIFRLNVRRTNRLSRQGLWNIVHYWGTLWNQVIQFLLFWEHHLIQILSAVIREHFVHISVKIYKIVFKRMKITLFCRFDYLSRFTHLREHFWPAALDRGTPKHYRQFQRFHLFPGLLRVCRQSEPSIK